MDRNFRFRHNTDSSTQYVLRKIYANIVITILIYEKKIYDLFCISKNIIPGRFTLAIFNYSIKFFNVKITDRACVVKSYI